MLLSLRPFQSLRYSSRSALQGNVVLLGKSKKRKKPALSEANVGSVNPTAPSTAASATGTMASQAALSESPMVLSEARVLALEEENNLLLQTNCSHSAGLPLPESMVYEVLETTKDEESMPRRESVEYFGSVNSIIMVGMCGRPSLKSLGTTVCATIPLTCSRSGSFNVYLHGDTHSNFAMANLREGNAIFVQGRLAGSLAFDEGQGGSQQYGIHVHPGQGSVSILKDLSSDLKNEMSPSVPHSIPPLDANKRDMLAGMLKNLQKYHELKKEEPTIEAKNDKWWRGMTQKLSEEDKDFADNQVRLKKNEILQRIHKGNRYQVQQGASEEEENIFEKETKMLTEKQRDEIEIELRLEKKKVLRLIREKEQLKIAMSKEKNKERLSTRERKLLKKHLLESLQETSKVEQSEDQNLQIAELKRLKKKGHLTAQQFHCKKKELKGQSNKKKKMEEILLRYKKLSGRPLQWEKELQIIRAAKLKLSKKDRKKLYQLKNEHKKELRRQRRKQERLAREKQKRQRRKEKRLRLKSSNSRRKGGKRKRQGDWLQIPADALRSYI